MSLMSNLYIGNSGLMSSQNSLNTTAHNLSNIDTKGFTRQQIIMGDRRYNSIGNAAVSPMQLGLGTDVQKVRQVRDFFLDQRYRQEVGRQAFYEETAKTVTQLEDFFGELEGVSFQESLENLWVAVQEVQKDPTNSVKLGLFVNQSYKFLERADAVYNGLVGYQNTLNKQAKDLIDKINDYGEMISSLNGQIRMIEKGGQEEANDLRDKRNFLLDQLGSMVKIKYAEDIDGVVTVSIEGVQFVTSDRVQKMGYREEENGFYTAIWPEYDDMEVYNLSREVSSDLNTDIGQLKGILLARGDHSANFTDLYESDPSGNGSYPQFNRPGYYTNTISQSLIMNVQAEFDNLIHEIVTQINMVLNPPDANGNSTNYDMFLRLSENRDHNVVGEDLNVPETMYTCGNLKINPDLLQDETLLSFYTKDGKADQAKADALVQAFSKKYLTLNPNATDKNNFTTYYENIVKQYASLGSVFRNVAETQTSTVESIENSRQMVMGVSSSEELTNMIKFQNAYNASSRYINVVSEMLEHLIMRLGG